MASISENGWNDKQSSSTTKALTVEEDDARLLCLGHLEEVPDHSRSFSHVLLDQLGADDSDEARFGSIGDGTRAESLASSRRSVEHHAARDVDAEVDEALWLKRGESLDCRNLDES